MKKCRFPWRRLSLTVLCAATLAPTPGDIGGCGKSPKLLSANKFFESKRELDCGACQGCNIQNTTCSTVCTKPIPGSFPLGCFPLVHDGEVCLRALSYSSCDEYRTYLDDEAPEVPTECNFCPPRAEPSLEGDAGTTEER